MSIYDFKVITEAGETYTLERYRGQVMVIVNTATKCGLAGQFADLEALYEKYREQGLVVLGFPSDQFKQELASGQEAAEACRLTYGVTFPMHQLVRVNGKETDPLFAYLKQEAPGALGTTIKWNFTKFLVDRDGRVVTRFAPKTEVAAMIPEIEKMI